MGFLLLDSLHVSDLTSLLADPPSSKELQWPRFFPHFRAKSLRRRWKIAVSVSYDKVNDLQK